LAGRKSGQVQGGSACPCRVDALAGLRCWPIHLTVTAALGWLNGSANAFDVSIHRDKGPRRGYVSAMLPRLLSGLLTIALMIGAGTAAAQSCAITPTLPAPQSAPVSNLPAAQPPPSMNLPAAQSAPGGNLNLVNGLVAYWKFDDASGTSVADSAGSNTATWVGTTTSQWTTGKINGGGNFNGLNNTVDIGSNAALKPQLPITVSAWVKVSNLTSGNDIIIANDGQNANRAGMLVSVNTDGSIFLSIFDNIGAGGRRSKSGPSGSITTGAWYHVVGVFRSVTTHDMSIYVNGVDVGGTYSGGATSLGYSSVNGVIGHSFSFPSQYFPGVIDEVGFWNRALSASEVATLYHGGNGDPFGNSSCGFSY
jgi:hypothetical protein